MFSIWPREGEPYLGRAGDLRRRLSRLLSLRDRPGRLLNLRTLAERIEYWPVASRLESWLVLYERARQVFPQRYMEFLKLRMPPFVRLLAGPFPRMQVTARLGSTGLTYGPFRTRALAEQFENQVLDLFQLRRCQEDLEPHPEHPGCIYGEMNMCLRPCQTAVSIDEYASEAERVASFLRTDGKKSLQTAQAARDRLSSELDFEGASREHKRVERIEELLRLRDELARETGQLRGVAVTPAVPAGTASLWFLIDGAWQPPIAFGVSSGDTLSLDKRLKDVVSAIAPMQVSPRERAEHLAILARWFYSSWRDGNWIAFESVERISYRRLVTAVSKVVHSSVSAASDETEKGR